MTDLNWPEKDVHLFEINLLFTMMFVLGPI